MKLAVEITQTTEGRYDLDVYGEEGNKDKPVHHVYEHRKGIRRGEVEDRIRGAMEVAMDNLEGDGEPEEVEEDKGEYWREAMRDEEFS